MAGWAAVRASLDHVRRCGRRYSLGNRIGAVAGGRQPSVGASCAGMMKVGMFECVHAEGEACRDYGHADRAATESGFCRCDAYRHRRGCAWMLGMPMVRGLAGRLPQTCTSVTARMAVTDKATGATFNVLQCPARFGRPVQRASGSRNRSDKR